MLVETAKEVPVTIQLADVPGYDGKPLKVEVGGRWNIATGRASFFRINRGAQEQTVPVTLKAATVKEVVPSTSEASPVQS